MLLHFYDTPRKAIGIQCGADWVVGKRTMITNEEAEAKTATK
jgi:hypothetical protein